VAAKFDSFLMLTQHAPPHCNFMLLTQRMPHCRWPKLSAAGTSASFQPEERKCMSNGHYSKRMRCQVWPLRDN
jgi:hypothetical protein